MLILPQSNLNFVWSYRNVTNYDFNKGLISIDELVHKIREYVSFDVNTRWKHRKCIWILNCIAMSGLAVQPTVAYYVAYSHKTRCVHGMAPWLSSTHFGEIEAAEQTPQRYYFVLLGIMDEFSTVCVQLRSLCKIRAQIDVVTEGNRMLYRSESQPLWNGTYIKFELPFPFKAQW